MFHFLGLVELLLQFRIGLLQSRQGDVELVGQGIDAVAELTDFIIENLLRPQERQLTNEYVYRESLHGTNITRAFALRAPPYVFA